MQNDIIEINSTTHTKLKTENLDFHTHKWFPFLRMTDEEENNERQIYTTFVGVLTKCSLSMTSLNKTPRTEIKDV